MNAKDMLTLRKPLAPKGDDAECKTAYEELLKEFNELKHCRQTGPVPARVRSAAAARNRKGPAKRSFCGVCPRVSPE